jgi:hypothetical protein
MVLPDSNRIPRVPLYSGTCSPLFSISPTGLSPSVAQLSRRIRLSIGVDFIAGPTTPSEPKFKRFRLFPLRSPLLRESRLISFPQGTEMFHFPWFAFLTEYQLDSWWVSPFGHFRIEACIAAPRNLSQLYYVLHRLWTPRHPPCAINNLHFLPDCSLSSAAL